MAGDNKIKYPVDTSITIGIDLIGLASDTNLLAGRESDQIDNTSDLDIDHLITGVITMSSTTPTAGRVVQVWAYSFEQLLINFGFAPSPFTGADSNRSAPSANWRDSALRLLWMTVTDAAANRNYYMPATSIAQAFGGTMPPMYGLWVVQSSGQTLAGGSLFATRVQAQYT
jgi:hypothetical protein